MEGAEGLRAANKIIIMQAANNGVTGGSTPDGADYDREIVIAEHNFGHLYEPKRALIDHYKSLDPSNCFNPGIGRTSKLRHWSLPPLQGPASSSQVNKKAVQ
jgi:FAD/FMN-containing dehydrogenase